MAQFVQEIIANLPKQKILLWERSSTGNISVKTIFGAGAVDESFGIIQFRKCDGGVASTSDDGTGHGYQPVWGHIRWSENETVSCMLGGVNHIQINSITGYVLINGVWF